MPRTRIMPNDEEGVFAPKRNILKPPMPKVPAIVGTNNQRQTTFPGQTPTAQLGGGALRRFNLPGATPLPSAAPVTTPPVSSTIKPPSLRPGLGRFNPNMIANMDPDAWARLQLLLGVEPLGG